MSDLDLDRIEEVARAATPGDHVFIWLQSAEEADGHDGRLWCEDKIWDAEFGDGEPTRYVRSDIAEGLIERMEKAEAVTEQFNGIIEDRHAEIATLRAALAEAVEALVVLNAALDAFWNAPDRGPVWNIRGTVVQDISDAQTRSARIVAKHEEPEHD